MRRLLFLILLLLAVCGIASADSYTVYCDDGSTRSGTYNPPASQMPDVDPCLTSSPPRTPAPQRAVEQRSWPEPEPETPEPALPDETWREANARDEEPQTAPEAPPQPQPLTPPQRPANVHASTTGGLTAIGWAPPIHVDDVHCPVACYVVEVIELAGGTVVYGSGDVYGLAVTTRDLPTGAQYDVEVSAYSADCDTWSEPGVHTYQH